MAKRTWEELEQPILEAVAFLEDELDDVRLPELAQRTGLPLNEVRIGVRRLLDTDLLVGVDASTMGEFDVISLRLLPRGRQAVGQWPSSDPREALLQLLSERIAVESDPEELGRLEKLRDSAGQVSKGVATGLLTALVQQVAGLG